MARTHDLRTPSTWSYRRRSSADQAPATAGVAGPRGGRHTGTPHDSEQPRDRYPGSGIAPGVVVLMLAAACVVVVVAQNTDAVRFEFLWWDAHVSLAALLLAAGLVVAVLDELVGLVWRRRRRAMRAFEDRP
jgi:uncharacterized integral membrane protein